MKVSKAKSLVRIKAALFVIALSAASSINSATGMAWAKQPGTASPPSTVPSGFYQPLEADFRPLYEADAANKAHESWNGDSGYWTWVQRFYKGYTYFIVFTPGWNDQAAKALTGLGEAERGVLVKRFNKTGRLVAGEWSKDNGVRRIDTGDLKRWSEQLKAASKRGPADKKSADLTACLDQIDREIARKLAVAPRGR